MDITYNGLTSNLSLITFTDVPNILTIMDDTQGSKTLVYITINSGLGEVTTSDGQWYIKILDDTITNVVTPEDAHNKSFYVSNDAASSVASIVKALRACANVAANFTVENSTYNSAPCVKLLGRDNAKLVYDGWFDTNISSAYTSTVISQSGYTPQQGAYIDVDVYSDGNYVTTLEKSFYGNSCAFNMSPVLTTIAKQGKAVPYNFMITSFNPNDATPYSTVGTVTSNYIVNGYMCNQGQKYLTLDMILLAANYTRGKEREFENNTILYTYFSEIPFSFYTDSASSGNIEISYLDSAENVIYSATTTFIITDLSERLYDYKILLNHQGKKWFNEAFYVDINFGDNFTLRYNIIKPLKAAENAQRILWRNSYGGISFFDFVGKRSETRNLEVTTYQKNIFDYYDSPDKNELKKVYNNKVEYQVTLKSHLINNDAKYIFNDLLQSSDVWTDINNEKYAIIIDSVSVEETSQDNVYEATVKYTYSQEPSELV